MAATTATASDRATLLRLMLTGSELVKTQVHRTLAAAGLSDAMITMLWALSPDAEPMSMREVAAKLNYDPSNVSLLTDRMEALGYVERRAHPTDGRRRVLALTDSGRELYERMLNQLYEESPLFQLTASEQQRLQELLVKVEGFAKRQR